MRERIQEENGEKGKGEEEENSGDSNNERENLMGETKK